MIKNMEVINKISNELMQEERRQKTRETMLVLMAKAALSRNLVQAIGEKSKHFIVNIYPAGGYMVVSLKTRDAIGSYIYLGTKSHYISSSQAMPIGNNRFARNVTHPGTDSLKSKIDAAVAKSLAEIRMGMRTIR